MPCRVGGSRTREVLGHLRDANRAHFSDDQLELLDTQARKGLESAGTSVRYALADGEHALEFGLMPR